MAFDPNQPFVVPEWEAYIDAVQLPEPLQVAAPEYPIGTGGAGLPPLPPPPPPPPPDKKLAAPGVPTQEEVPRGALEPVGAEPPGLLTPPLIEAPERPPAPPLLGEVDAISGGITDEQKDRIVGRTDARGATTAAPTQTPDDYLTGEELGAAMRGRSLEERAAFQRGLDAERQKFVLEETVKADNQARWALEENARRWEQAQRDADQYAAKLDAEAKQLAEMTPLERMSDGQAIASVVAGIIGGFAGMRQGGGKNLGADTIKAIADSAAQRHVERMQLNARQRGAIGEKRQAAGDAYRMGDVVRLATYNAALNKIKTDVQQLNPRGAMAERAMQDYAKIDALYADALRQVRDAEAKQKQQQFENELKLGELGVKVGELDLKRQKQAGAGVGKGDKEPHDPAYFQQKYGGTIPTELLPTAPMSEKDFRLHLETTDKGRAAANKLDARRIVGVMPDGSDFIARAGDDTTVTKVRDQVTAYKSMVRLIDDARRIRTGWTSDTAKSKEWQELKTIWANAKGKGKNALGLGAMSDSDFALVGEYLGTDDPTRARGVEHAIVKARQLVIQDANDALKSVGYTGKFDIKDLQERGPTASNEDKELDVVLGTTNTVDDMGNMLADPAQVALINKWAGLAASAPDEATRERYVGMLDSAATKAKIKSLRGVAREALLRASTPSAPTEDVGPSIAVARETAPPEPEE